jgi:hypothetical protein
MMKNDYYHDPAQVKKGTITYTRHGAVIHIIVNLITVYTFRIGFLNREWRFTKKSLPQMELAPWGTTEPLVLHMLRQ